jgi:hypothetical protein
MNDVALAMNALGKGPRGGNLNNPDQHPERRRSGFKPIALHGDNNGMPGLHRFNRDAEDVAGMGLQNEQPWHRMAAFMLLTGRTNSEIALAANVGVQAVVTLRQQRWFQELLATLANDKGEEITGVIESYTLEAVEEIHSIMQSAESDRVRLAAATTLLEQGRGKAVQHIRTEKVKPRDPKEELEELERDLSAVRGQLETT